MLSRRLVLGAGIAALSQLGGTQGSDQAAPLGGTRSAQGQGQGVVAAPPLLLPPLSQDMVLKFSEPAADFDSVLFSHDLATSLGMSYIYSIA